MGGGHNAAAPSPAIWAGVCQALSRIGAYQSASRYRAGAREKQKREGWGTRGDGGQGDNEKHTNGMMAGSPDVHAALTRLSNVECSENIYPISSCKPPNGQEKDQSRERGGERIM